MNYFASLVRKRGWLLYFCLLLSWLTWGWEAGAATNSKAMTQVAKWSRFEHSFKSTVAYANPLENAMLTVVFTSPLGETMKVYGFWDGGKIWQVRFSPDMPGIWKFRTVCSDTTNRTLHNVTGEFLCTPSSGHSSFDRHGPVRVARDHRHLEYQDHTPFFWLADTAWDGVRLSKPDEWNFYAQVRARQKFTVTQWVTAPGGKAEKPTAYTGTEHIKINLDFFKKLDAKVETLNRAGILNAIVPFLELTPKGTNGLNALPEEQVILLLRYMVARWGASDVVWLLTCEGEQAARWKRIGRSVFRDAAHAPVMLYPGEAYWALEDFRAESWLDGFGYQSGQETTEDALQWMLAGPIRNDWKKEPAHLFINLAPPYENEAGGRFQPRTSPQAVRRAAYWSLLNTPTTGVSYGGHGVWDWEIEVDARSATPDYQAWAMWQKALFLPAAKEMGTVADVFNSIEFWRLRPAPELVANQPGVKFPARYIAAAQTVSGDLAVIYTPEAGTIELNAKTLPSSANTCWINPRTGARIPVVIAKKGQTYKLSTPAAGDWLLLIKAVKK